jgi:hypothetical protein
MPSLKLALNIGVPDAKRLGLTKTAQGETVSVSGEVADELLKRGWAFDPSTGQLSDEATPTSSATPRPGEAQIPEGAEPAAPPDFDAMTKEELHEHARANNIEGVTMAQNKDDMIRTVKRASRTR